MDRQDKLDVRVISYLMRQVLIPFGGRLKQGEL